MQEDKLNAEFDCQAEKQIAKGENCAEADREKTRSGSRIIRLREGVIGLQVKTIGRRGGREGRREKQRKRERGWGEER